MKSAVIIHGAYGNPDENWFPWLGEELEKLGYKVYRPKLPTPENQNLQSWKINFEEIGKAWTDENTILIGHSIGVAFALRLLMDEIDAPVKAAFLVAGFSTQLNDSRFDSLNKSFLKEPFDWNLIKKNCQQFFVYHSDNDPYVSLGKGKELAENLSAKVQLIPDAGHFNEDAGYTTFNELLEDIKKL